MTIAIAILCGFLALIFLLAAMGTEEVGFLIAALVFTICSVILFVVGDHNKSVGKAAECDAGIYVVSAVDVDNKEKPKDAYFWMRDAQKQHLQFCKVPVENVRFDVVSHKFPAQVHLLNGEYGQYVDPLGVAEAPDFGDKAKTVHSK